jgi:hypothetical protein
MATTFFLAYADSSVFFQLKNSFDDNPFHAPRHMHIYAQLLEKESNIDIFCLLHKFCVELVKETLCLPDLLIGLFLTDLLAIAGKRKRVQPSRKIIGQPNGRQRQHNQCVTGHDIGALQEITCEAFDDILPEAIPDGI